MKIKIKITKVRNPLYAHPLLKKGGVHDKSRKVNRQGDKQKLKIEWGSLIVLLISIIKEFYSNDLKVNLNCSSRIQF